jgi:orotate phosphoribosyltransferase
MLIIPEPVDVHVVGNELNIDNIVQGIAKITNANRPGHFQLHSGLHTNLYFEKARLLEHPRYVSQIGACFDFVFPEGFNVVLSATVGGIILGYEVGRRKNIRTIFAEPCPEGRMLRRGFSIGKCEKVLIIDDVLTTGDTISELAKLVRLAGGIVFAAGVIIDRSTKALLLDFPVFALSRVEAATWTSEQCPWCKLGIALERPGSGERR